MSGEFRATVHAVYNGRASARSTASYKITKLLSGQYPAGKRGIRPDRDSPYIGRCERPHRSAGDCRTDDTTGSVPASKTTTKPLPARVPPAEPIAPAPTTTTTPLAPVALTAPKSSPSGSSVATVVDSAGTPTLQIADSAGAVQYSAPVTASDKYGYGVTWALGDQLWLLGPTQLVRLDPSGGSWTRTVIDPSATEDIPAEIAAQL